MIQGSDEVEEDEEVEEVEPLMVGMVGVLEGEGEDSHHHHGHCNIVQWLFTASRGPPETLMVR